MKPLIFENTPYRSDKNLVVSYNSFMELIPDTAWALFRDGDTMFLDSYYGITLENVINKNPNCGCFTAITNRIYPKQQRISCEGDDIEVHRKMAKEQLNKYGSECLKMVPKPYMSGFCFLLKKATWKKIGGFKPWHKNGSTMLGVDNQLHIDLIKHNIDVMIMQGVYVYHWYRGGNGNKTEHLK